MAIPAMAMGTRVIAAAVITTVVMRAVPVVLRRGRHRRSRETGDRRGRSQGALSRPQHERAEKGRT
ncbi:hypothetical protein [Microbispora sp. NPDC046933]|uniref:hypothetical protein n=1 Tax=Microbispora sp. NPDC046933 TaxID=3155618 RepID=UPI0033E2DC9D